MIPLSTEDVAAITERTAWPVAEPSAEGFGDYLERMGADRKYALINVGNALEPYLAGCRGASICVGIEVWWADGNKPLAAQTAHKLPQWAKDYQVVVRELRKQARGRGKKYLAANDLRYALRKSLPVEEAA